jgi:hypothetical protein
MCFSVKNQTNESVTAIQVIQSGTPVCFHIPAGKTVSQQVSLESAWKVIGDDSGKVFTASVSPNQSRYTFVADSYVPAPVFDCNTMKSPSTAKKFAVIGFGFLVAGVVCYGMLKAQWTPTKAYSECLPLSGAAQCLTLYPQKHPEKMALVLGMVLAGATFGFWQLMLGPLGGMLAGEPKKTVSCSECVGRGTGWNYTEPSVADGVKGFKLWLRKMRCRYNTTSGSCMCYNDNDRFTCQTAAADSRAPKNLQWQPDIANRVGTNTVSADVCACCTDVKGSMCYDVRETDPLLHPCVAPPSGSK